MTGVMGLEPADLARLAAVVTRRSGMAFGEPRWPFLERRARELMARAGFGSAGPWLDALEASVEAQRGPCADLEEALRIHETSFFRYPAHHRALAEVVLPWAARDSARVRILSVGCATGEEPYSIAMTVRDSLPAEAADRAEIVAVDASRDALAAALCGSYPTRRGEAAVPPPLLATYFVREPGAVALVPAIRRMVRFFHQDIRSALYLGRFHAVFCCNVLLYLTAPVRRQVLGRLAEGLWDGGYLFLGHAEGATPPAPLFEVSDLPAGFVYRRRARATALPSEPVAHG